MISPEQRPLDSGDHPEAHGSISLPRLARISFAANDELAELFGEHLLVPRLSNETGFLPESVRFNPSNAGSRIPFPVGSELSIIGLRHSIQTRRHDDQGQLDILHTRLLLLPPYQARRTFCRLVGRADTLSAGVLELEMPMAMLQSDLQHSESELDAVVGQIDHRLNRVSSGKYSVRSLGIRYESPSPMNGA